MTCSVTVVTKFILVKVSLTCSRSLLIFSSISFIYWVRSISMYISISAVITTSISVIVSTVPSIFISILVVISLNGLYLYCLIYLCSYLHFLKSVSFQNLQLHLLHLLTCHPSYQVALLSSHTLNPVLFLSQL